MDTEIDWQHELDLSFGAGDDVAAGHYVEAGRRAVRRRRASVVAAGVGLAAVVAGIAWSAAPGTAPRGEAPVATDPSATASATPTAAADRFADLPWRKGDPPARTSPDGLQVREGAVVHQRRDDLYPGKDTESVALDLTYAGTRWWVVLEWDEGGSTGASTHVEDAPEPSFDAFVDAQTSGGGMTTQPATTGIDFLGNPGALTDQGLQLAPKAGPVLQLFPNPMDYTAAEGDSVAIRVMFRGREQYSLMARFPDGSTSTTTNDASGDFQGWLAGVVASQHTLDVANGVVAPSGDATETAWLTLGPDGEVTSSRSGIVITEQRVGIDLGPRFAEGSDRTGAVRLLVDGRPQYAAYRVVGGELDVVPGGGSFDSMAAFLDWARSQYASGAGMR